MKYPATHISSQLTTEVPLQFNNSPEGLTELGETLTLPLLVCYTTYTPGAATWKRGTGQGVEGGH